MAEAASPNHDLSIVIPAFNAAETIGPQLAAIARELASVDGVRVEVVVADNGSSDDTVERVQAWSDRLPVRCVDASEGRGAAIARNAGVKATAAPFLVFVDADDVVMPGWMAGWVNASRTIAFGTGPLVEFVDGAPPDELPAVLPTAPLVHMGFLPYAYGANFGVKRSLWENAGGMDPRFLMAQDVEFSWRLQMAGVALEFVPRRGDRAPTPTQCQRRAATVLSLRSKRPVALQGILQRWHASPTDDDHPQRRMPVWSRGCPCFSASTCGRGGAANSDDASVVSPDRSNATVLPVSESATRSRPDVAALVLTYQSPVGLDRCLPRDRRSDDTTRTHPGRRQRTE